MRKIKGILKTRKVMLMETFICQLCLEEKPKSRFASRIKFCPECRAKAHNLREKIRYYRRTAQQNPTAKIDEEKKQPLDFEKKCPVNNCKFKSGNKPCMFFFKYKNGKTHCPNYEEYEKKVKIAKKFKG